MQHKRKLPEMAGYAIYESYMDQHRHIEMVIDMQEKKIYLNRAADQAANVVQVRFRQCDHPKQGLRLPWQH